MSVPDEIATSWHEKHRPQSLNDLALDPAVRERFESVLRTRILSDHLLLSGPPGVGKTTLARIIIKATGCQDVLELNASKDRGIEVIRDKVETFARTHPWGGIWKAVFLDEADGLTPEAQEAMRGLMEKYSFQTKFIFTANEPDQIIVALQSRCERVEMNTPPAEERARVLALVLAKEGHDVPLEAAHAFAVHYSDMRPLLREAQTSIETRGTLQVPAITATAAGWGEVWPDPVDGAQLLDEIAAQFSRYVALPDGAAPTLALWTLFTWAHECFAYSPILALTSPTPEAGKSLVLDIMERMTARTEYLVNPTGPSLFGLGKLTEVGEREDQQPPMGPTPPQLTLLGDEVDAWMRLDNQIRVVLNSGHRRRGARVPRRFGPVTRFWSTWFPKALAFIEGLGFALPPATRGRCIIVPMKRASRKEAAMLKEFRSQDEHDNLTVLKRKAAGWALQHFFALREVDPVLPDELGQREKNRWSPLFAIASVAGGLWPEITLRSCLRLTGLVGKTEALGEMLLHDIREIFASDGHNPDWLPSLVLVANLKAMEGRPWGEALAAADDAASARKLARILEPFDIESKYRWTPPPGAKEKTSLAGYWFADFADAFEHYLPNREGPGDAPEEVIADR